MPRLSSGAALGMLLTVLLLTLETKPARAGDTFWQRVAQAAASERRTLLAVERVLLGHGDEHDAMAAQTALLDYTRGHSFRDARIEILLVRLRLDTHWSGDRRIEKRLGVTLERPLPVELQGIGWADWGSLAALRGDVSAARVRFQRAVELLWEGGPRARALLGRGWSRLASGDARQASDDFRNAALVTDDRRIEVAALWSLALALHRGGQQEDARLAMQRAGNLEALRARASGRSPFDGLVVLPSYEAHAIRALQMQWQAERARAAEDFEGAAATQRTSCEELRRYLLRAEPEQSPWARAVRADWLGCQEVVAGDEASAESADER